MNEEKPPAEPEPSATVLAIRDGESGLEVFMIRRHDKMEFMSGAFVFPGGKTDRQDEDPRLLALCDGPNDDISVYRIAAVREAFEECGVLLARRAGQEALVSGKDLLRLEHWRSRVHEREATLYDFLTAEGLRLACDMLIRFAHWITPLIMPRRFDTQFFLVAAPADQLLAHDGHESVDSLWIRPQDAERAAKEGTHNIIFPTLCNLQKLGMSSTVAEATEAAQTSEIIEVLPTREKADGDYFLVLPVAAGYPVNRIKLPKQAPRQ